MRCLSKRHDFTQGNILKQLIIFSGPIMLADLLQTSFQVIDSIWIGNLLGANALGAVAIASSILLTVLSFVIGINNATLAVLSQQKGRGDREGLKSYLNAFVLILTTLAVVLSVIGYFTAIPLLKLLGTPLEMLEPAKVYLQIHYLGIIFLFGYNFISTVLRAVGDSKTPLRFVLIAVILKTILAPLFISVFKWGIEGAALATITAQGIAFLYGLIHVYRRKLAPFSLPFIPKAKEVRLILNLGIPSGLQMAVIFAGSAAVMSVVTNFGGDVVAGFGASQRLDSLLLLPAHALSIAVSSMAGQNIGIRNWNRVRTIAKYGVIYNLIFMLSIATLVVIFAEYGVRMFIQEEAAVQFGTEYLRIIAFCFPFIGMNFILNGIVRASGAMYQVLILNFISFWVLRFPLTSFFSVHFGEKGIAIGMGASFILSSIFAALYYFFGKWREKELFKEKVKEGESE